MQATPEEQPATFFAFLQINCKYKIIGPYLELQWCIDMLECKMLVKEYEANNRSSLEETCTSGWNQDKTGLWGKAHL